MTSCDNDDTNEETELIIHPGQGINNLKIGDLGERVEAELGDGFAVIMNGVSNPTYNYFHDNKGIDIVFGQQNSPDLDINTLPIQRFFLYENFEGMTEEGIQIGSTRTEVVDTYGDPDQENTFSSDYNIGIRFIYDMDVVSDIYIEEL